MNEKCCVVVQRQEESFFFYHTPSKVGLFRKTKIQNGTETVEPVFVTQYNSLWVRSIQMMQCWVTTYQLKKSSMYYKSGFSFHGGS